jgi:hypothetical protein
VRPEWSAQERCGCAIPKDGFGGGVVVLIHRISVADDLRQTVDAGGCIGREEARVEGLQQLPVARDAPQDDVVARILVTYDDHFFGDGVWVADVQWKEDLCIGIDARQFDDRVLGFAAAAPLASSLATFLCTRGPGAEQANR